MMRSLLVDARASTRRSVPGRIATLILGQTVVNIRGRWLKCARRRWSDAMRSGHRIGSRFLCIIRRRRRPRLALQEFGSQGIADGVADALRSAAPALLGGEPAGARAAAQRALDDFGDTVVPRSAAAAAVGLYRRGIAQPGRAHGDALGRGAVPHQPAAIPGRRAARPRHPAPADRAADLHHRPAAQRHHVPAPAADGGPGQPGAAGLADDLSVSAADAAVATMRARRAWRGSCEPSSGWRRSSARCIRSTRPRRRSAARSPRMCSAACASTRPTASRAIGAGWMQASHLPAYRFHRRFLQHLQHQAPGGRWVVKCPDHLFALDAIRTVYPDARLVFVHRDPVKVLLSVAKLTEVLRRPFTRRLDPREIGRQESARWLDGTQQMIAVGDDAGLPEPVHHVHHNDAGGGSGRHCRGARTGISGSPWRRQVAAAPWALRRAASEWRLRSARLSLRGPGLEVEAAERGGGFQQPTWRIRSSGPARPHAARAATAACRSPARTAGELQRQNGLFGLRSRPRRS